MRWLWPALMIVLVAACAGTPTRRPAQHRQPAPQQAQFSAPAPRAAGVQAAFDPCAPTRRHLDSDYTPGGLYAPGVADGGPPAPIDVSGVREPVPRAEPRSRYGNRSPYTVLGKTYHVLERADGYSERGVASWYGSKFNGRATSSGELYDICIFSAAHKTLPLPSFVRVTNLDNGRSLIVRVNDRGPFHAGRIMDLSYAAAVRLGVDRTGTARVELQAITGNAVPLPVQLASQAPALRPLDPIPAAADQRIDVDGEHFVQVGSFADKSNARRLADRLEDAGLGDVDLDHAQIGEQDVWRVRIGPVRGHELASLLERLRQLGLPNPHVFSE